MNPLHLTPLALAVTLLGASIARPAPAAANGPADTSAAAAPARVAPTPPLLVDPGDLGFGATVVFTRIPTAPELHDLQYLESVSHVVLQLPAWPAGIDALQPLAQEALPEGADLVVVLPGYPDTQAQSGAWNLLRRPVRIIMVVTAPPENREMVFRLNAIRGLERVVADLPRPSRAGFERLQRPLTFRVLMP